jgi:hypothetical protein
MRVACYIDGFNLYHSLDDLKKPHLKWLDLWALAKSLCRHGETLEKVAYFSAYATWRPDAYARHRQYVAALKSSGVECHMARFSEQHARCHKCGATWKRHEEKETDVHFSLTFLEDAIDDIFDRAIIISADGDHIPAVRKIKNPLASKAAICRDAARATQVRSGTSGRLSLGHKYNCWSPSKMLIPRKDHRQQRYCRGLETSKLCTTVLISSAVGDLQTTKGAWHF